MDLQKLLDKLEPLIPQQVQQWRRHLLLYDDTLKSVLIRQIIHTAHNLLGEYDRRLLLSLPPEKLAKGELQLGTIMYEKERHLFGINKKELLQNLAIFGRSGAGKTNTAFILLQQLVHAKVPFLFLDWKRTGRHLMPSLATPERPIQIYTPGRSLLPFVFNPFIPPPGLEHRVYINILVDVLGEAFTLGDGSKSILQNAIAQAYKEREVNGAWPTANEIHTLIYNLELKSRAAAWKVSAIRALQSLGAMDLGQKEGSTQESLMRSLIQTSTILELDGLNEGEKKFLIPLLCLWVFHTLLASSEKREELRLAILVEEAHHVLYKGAHRSKETVMNQLLRQCRELGIGMIIVDQHPHLISSAALGNTYTSICLNLKQPADINLAAELSLLDNADAHWLSELPVGHGIIKLQDRFTKPILVKFPEVQIEIIENSHRPPVEGVLIDKGCTGGERVLSYCFMSTITERKDC